MRVREFLDACPPFRALIYSQHISDYELMFRAEHGSVRLIAGRNDLYMSVYLPYCNEFVTRDCGQKDSLRAVVEFGGLQTDVLSFTEFRERIAAECPEAKMPE